MFPSRTWDEACTETTGAISRRPMLVKACRTRRRSPLLPDSRKTESSLLIVATVTRTFLVAIGAAEAVDEAAEAVDVILRPRRHHRLTDAVAETETEKNQIDVEVTGDLEARFAAHLLLFVHRRWKRSSHPLALLCPRQSHTSLAFCPPLLHSLVSTRFQERRNFSILTCRRLQDRDLLET